jgi:hypothetical protein
MKLEAPYELLVIFTLSEEHKESLENTKSAFGLPITITFLETTSLKHPNGEVT